MNLFRQTTPIFLLVTILLTSTVTNMAAGVEEAGLPPLVRVPPIQVPPKIDGVISPGEWDRAFMGSGVARVNTGGLDPIPVRYWFAYDEKNVYFAGQMQTPPGKNLCVVPRRLARSPEDYHFEFLVDPNPCHPDKNWVQAMLYPMGKFQNTGYSQRIGGFVPYDVEWTYQDSWKDDWWTIEFSAPAEALNRATLQNGQSWGVLFAGLISTGPYYFSGQLGEAFAKRARYLKMILDRDAPVIQVTDMGDVSTGQASPKILVRNVTGQDLDLKVDFATKTVPAGYFSTGLDSNAAWSKSESKTLAVAKGASAEASWSVEVPKDEKTMDWLFMTVSSADGKTRYYEGIYKLTKPRAPKWNEVKAEPPAPVMLETYLYPYPGKLKAVLDFGGLDDPAQVAEARFRVTDAHGKEVAASTTKQFENRATEHLIALPENLADGDYTVKAELLDAGGKVLKDVIDSFKRKKFEFERNSFGISEQVLYPWTPIKCQAADDRAQVEVWNRTYSLGKDGLPEKIVTDGKPVLAAPIALLEKVDGKFVALKGDGMRVTKTADHAFEATATASGRKVKADVKLRGEYDGMLKYEISIRGAKGAKLDGLDLVMPISEAHAKFLHATGDGCRSNYSHELPAGTGQVWDSTAVMNWVMPVQWLTYVWLGDYERGLCWWADSAEGWTLPKDKKTPVVEITRQGGVVTAVFHLINRPSTVLWKDEVPRKLVFAFEATPMKPRPAWVRDIGLCDMSVTKQKGPRMDWIGWTGWAFFGQEKENDPASGKYTFAYLRSINAAAEDALKKRTAQDDAAGRRMLIYTDMRARALVGEEERAFAWEWNPSADDPRKAFIQKAPYHAGIAINSSPSRVDFDLWCCKRLMDLGVAYFYFDEIQNEGQINPVAGLGYRDEDGKWMPTMRLFGYRDFWKRLYTLMQERGQKEPVIVMHNTSTTYAGPMAFCTTSWDFEEANSDPQYRQLTKFGIDYLNTEAMGHQYGFAASTLGPSRGFERWIREDQKEEEFLAGRHWMGVHMVLDMNPYLTSGPAVQQGLKTLGEFGWNEADCQWTGYWKAIDEKLYRYSPGPEKRVYVSMYRRGSKALLIFLNDTNGGATIQWKPGKLAVKGSLVDSEKPETKIDASGGTYRVPVPKYNYRAMLVETN